MSAIENLLKELDEHYNDPLGMVSAASAELAALRDSLGAWASLWAHICERLNADTATLPNESNFDAMISSLRADAFINSSVELLRATVAEQAEQLRQAHHIIFSLRAEADRWYDEYCKEVEQESKQLNEQMSHDVLEDLAAMEQYPKWEHEAAEQEHIEREAWLATNEPAPQAERQQPATMTAPDERMLDE